MSWSRRSLLVPAAAAGLLLAPGPAPAAFYTFTGTVTEVRDPFGAFSPLAAVGAPVTGSFGYSDTADYPDPFQFLPTVTAYLNDRGGRPAVTGLGLTIGGVGEASAPSSLTNLTVGDGVPGGDPFFPAGDFFRYVDTLAYPPGADGLVDYGKFDPENSFAIPFATLFLVDPTGGAFSSQDLPRGPLPLAALTDRYGEFSFFDGNGEDIDYGAIRFRIDSVAAVPEPASLGLLAAGGLGLLAARRRARAAG